ncbi:MAG: glycosyltransferase family 39 protein [Cyanobacteria bacterium SZAS-4]|nr:glycosyltransferase family 39 protein [Cyanobacteria bacterium SZAS-4]
MAFQTLAKEQATEHSSVVSTNSNWTVSKAQWLFLGTFAFVFASACVMFFYNLGNFPLFNPDEALYAEPAREMLETGEYITTWLNYAVRFTKPPLVIWAMAAGYQLFGVTEFAARYFGAACGAVLVAATYLFTRAQVNNRAALIAAFSLMTAPLFLGTAREAITDIPLSLFVTGSLMCFFHSYESRRTSTNSLELIVAYTAVGLAVMTKGPIGIILPVAILGIYHLLKWDVRSALLFYKPWFGILLVALIAVPWFAVEISVTKGAYYREFILRENFQRFTGVVDHKAAWWYHIAAMFGGFFPWTIFVPGALLTAINIEGSRWTNILTRFRKLTPRQSTMLLASLGSMIILGFFSAGVSKLIPYTLPAFPLLAVLVGSYVDGLWSKQSTKLPGVLFGILAVIYAGALAAIPIFGAKLHDCPTTLLSAVWTLLIVHAVAASFAAVLWLKQKYAAALVTFVAATFFALLIVGNQGLEAVSNQWETPIQSFAQFAGASKDTIIVYQMRKPSVTFYAKKKFLLPKSPKELTYILSKADRAYIISRSRAKEELKTLPGTKHLCQMGQYVLTSYARPTALKSSSTNSAVVIPDDKDSRSDD